METGKYTYFQKFYFGFQGGNINNHQFSVECFLTSLYCPPPPQKKKNFQVNETHPLLRKSQIQLEKSQEQFGA